MTKSLLLLASNSRGSYLSGRGKAHFA